MKPFHLTLAGALGASLLLAACLSEPEKNEDKDLAEGVFSRDSLSVATQAPYSAMFTTGSWPDVGYFIVPIPSLTEGVVKLEGNGAEMSEELYAQDVPQKNGFYYHAKSGEGTLAKYYVQAGQLKTVKKVPYLGHGLDTYTWLDDGTLITIGANSTSDTLGYTVINVKTLATVKSGKLDISTIADIADTNFTRYWIGATEYRDGKIFLSYGVGSSNWKLYPNMPVHGKGYVAVIDYSTMDVEKILTASSLKGSTGATAYAPASFQTENGDIYFVTDPGYEYDSVSASRIHRIPAGSTNLDTAYDFDLSSSINGGMGAAMWYIGGDKAIVRYRENAKNIDATHYFAVVNVKTGVFVKKLDLPLDIAERMIQAVIVVGGKAYIAVTSSGDDYIWEYDPATDKLTRGVQLVGADIVKRLENLK